MKNVIVFQEFIHHTDGRHDWKKEELFNYFRAQIDNSLYWGWDKKDIVVCTNYDFEYKDIKPVRLKKISTNATSNKQYAIYELFSEGIIKDNMWLHDFDDWQIGKFDFPEFSGDIGLAKYCGCTGDCGCIRWNCGSIFTKPSAIDIWELFYNFVEANKDNKKFISEGNDEIYIDTLHVNYPDVRDRISKINSEYNVGVSAFDDRYGVANKPIKVIAFKPNIKRDLDVFMNGKNSFNAQLVDNRLMELFKGNNIA